ncbi:MAG: aldolase, partial [Acidobacteriales bacterium]|nr:aldolase [Terriglobales bacterium]
MHCRSLFERGYSCGSSGNLSVRLDDGVLMTPTKTCLGRLDPARISKISSNGELLSGDKPSKEAFLHLAWYRSRPEERAVVHLHSTYSVAVSCMANLDPSEVLPPITAYYVMSVGHLPLVPYFPPGDRRLAEEVEQIARSYRAVLLANHGPVVGGPSLEAAVCAAEELEEAAKLYLLLRRAEVRY